MRLSVLIPTCNGAETLRELLAVLHYQSVQPDELLVVVSSSDDGTVELVRNHGAEVTVLPRADFDHGGTRTKMAEQATGDILLFFTQDAIPRTRDAVERLIRPLMDDGNVATSYGRQLPTKHAGFAAEHLRAFNYPPDSITRSYDDRRRFGIRTIFTSNTFAAYRKSALAEVGYFKNGLIFGEDTCTVGRLLQHGYRIAYVGDAAVYHSHDYDHGQEFRRSFDIGVLHATERELFDDFGKAESRGVEYVRSGLKQLKSKKKYTEMVDFLCRAGMKFLGYKLGRNYHRLPSALVPRLSMHSGWWKKNECGR